MAPIGAILSLLLFLFGIAITYFIIKLAVKHAINESLEDITSTVKEAIIAGLSEHKNQNK